MNQKTKRARGARHAGAGTHAKPPSPFTLEEQAELDVAARSLGFSDRLNSRLAGEQADAKESHALDEAQAAAERVEQAAAQLFGSEDVAEVGHVDTEGRGAAYAAAAQPFSVETKETTMTKFERVVIAVIVVALLGTAWACRYETLRWGRGLLRINRWTGQKYIEYPQFDSDGMKWIVVPEEPLAPPTPSIPAPAPGSSSGR